MTLKQLTDLASALTWRVFFGVALLATSACNPMTSSDVQINSISGFSTSLEISLSKSRIYVSNPQVASGNSITIALLLKDQNGNPYVSLEPLIAFGNDGGTSSGTIGSVSHLGNGAYSATFTGVNAGTPTTIIATVNGQSLTSPLPTVQVTSNSVSLSNSVLSVSSSSISAGGSSTITLTTRDANNNPLSTGGFSVSFGRSGGTSTGTFSSVVDRLDGTYTAVFTGTSSGTPTNIIATIGGLLVTSTAPTIQVSGGTPSSLSISSGNSQTQVVNSAFASPLIVSVRDASNQPLSGVTVQWSVTSGSGTLSGASSTTNASGLAQITLTAGTSAGNISVQAAIPAYSLSTPFTVAATAGAASKTVFATEPSSAGSAGTSLTTQPVIQIQDVYGNLVSTSSAAVTLALYSDATCSTAVTTTPNATNALSGTLTRTSSSGVATFTDVAIRYSLNALYLKASSSGLTADCSNAMNISAGAYSLNDSDLSVGTSTLASASSTIVTLTAKDSFGNSHPSGITTVAFARTTPTTGSFSAVAHLGNGVYTSSFTGEVAGTTTLSGLINAQVVNSTASVTVTAGPASAISITGGQNQSGFLGAALSTALAVQVTDAHSNPVLGATVQWSASSGTLGNGASTTTNSTGDTSNTLTIGTGSTAAGAQTITATLQGTTTFVTFLVTANVAAPTGLSGTNANAASNLSWSAVTGATSYKIYVTTTSGSGYTSPGTSLTTTYAASALTNGTTYYLAVSALNNGVESTRSSEVTVKPVVAPGAPQDLTGTLASTQTVLNWTAPATGTGPFSYKVYRSTSSGSGYSLVATTSSGTTTATDTGLTNGTTYYYVVSAINGSVSGESAYSQEFIVTPDYTSRLSYQFVDHGSFQAHNSISYSSDYAQSAWDAKSGIALLASVTNAPDGTPTATKIVETAATIEHRLARQIPYVSGNTYTLSIYAKKSENRYLQLALTAVAFGSNAYANFDLQNGTVATTASSATASIYSIGNGWYRCVVTATATASGTGISGFPLIQSGTDGRYPSYSGTAGNGIYVWGAQLELSPGVSRYVATTASAPLTSFVSPLTATSGTTGLTFSRSESSSISTLYGSDGLLRRSPHNQLNYSQELENAYWSKARMNVTANAATAPDGTTTAEKIIETSSTTGGTDHAIYRNSGISAKAGNTYTFSTYLKAGERTLAAVIVGNNNWTNKCTAHVNLSTGTVTSSFTVGSVSNCITQMVPSGDSWYRFSLSLTYGVNETSGMAAIYIRDSGGNMGYVGDDASGIYTWGQQFEENLSASTYVETTSAARYNSARYDFDPNTRASRGLLAEAARTNLFFRSQELDDSYWGKTAISMSANSATAPDGTTTAEKMVEDTSSATAHKSVNAVIAGTAGTTYTGSVYLKSAGRTYVSVQMTSGGLWPTASNPYLVLNLSSCTAASTYNVLATTTQALPNNWCRVSITQTLSTSGSTGLNFVLMTNSNTDVYTGDGTSGVYIWGAQFEQGANASSYIPTTSSALTRNIDVATPADMSWYSNTAGTVAIDFLENALVSTRAAFFYGGAGNVIFVGGRTAAGQAIKLNTKDSSTDVCSLFGGTGGYGVPVKLVAAIEAGNYATAVNGTLSTSSSSGNLIVPNSLYLGSDGSSTGMNGWIQRFRYYDSRLPDADVTRLSQ